MSIRPGSRRIAKSLTLMAALATVAAACGSSSKASSVVGETVVPSATTAASGSAASATTAGSTAEWDAIVAAAQDEGKVTIYSSQGLDQLNDLGKRFKDEYGIDRRGRP